MSVRRHLSVLRVPIQLLLTQVAGVRLLAFQVRDQVLILLPNQEEVLAMLVVEVQTQVEV